MKALFSKQSLLLAAALSLTTFPLLTFGQSDAFKAPLASESLLLDIASNKDGIIVVGERGHVLTSDDGVEFTQQSVPSTATLTSVFTLGEKVWAVGHDATILHSSDGGQTWVQQLYVPALEKPFMDVTFFDESHGIAVGAYGLFYRTTNGGMEWTAEQHPSFLHPDDQAYLEEIKLEDEAFYLEELNAISPHLNRLSVTDGTLYLAGEAGLLAKSEDLGHSWEQLPIDYLGSFFDLKRAKNGQLLAAGLRGHLYIYSDDSESWNRVTGCSDATLNSIIPVSENQTLVVGNNGTIIRLKDFSINAEILTPPEQTSRLKGCVAKQQVQLQQTEDSKSIIDAIVFNDKIVAVSAAGIINLAME